MRYTIGWPYDTVRRVITPPLMRYIEILIGEEEGEKKNGSGDTHTRGQRSF